MSSKKTYENGFHTISNEQYHSSAGISRSSLMNFKTSPLHFWYNHISGLKPKEEPKAAYALGNLVHTLVLEPDLYPHYFILSPECDRRTKNGKLIYDQFIERVGTKTIITQLQYDTALSMAKSVKKDITMDNLLLNTKKEESLYFTHKPSGLQGKVRPDAWAGTMAFDLKTTDNAGYKAFQSSASNYGYFMQAVMNYYAFETQDIILDEFIFLVVEKNAPFVTAIYRCDKSELNMWFDMFDELMMRLKSCLETDIWPGYGIRDLKSPSYLTYDQLVEIE